MELPTLTALSMHCNIAPSTNKSLHRLPSSHTAAPLFSARNGTQNHRNPRYTRVARKRAGIECTTCFTVDGVVGEGAGERVVEGAAYKVVSLYRGCHMGCQCETQLEVNRPWTVPPLGCVHMYLAVSVHSSTIAAWTPALTCLGTTYPPNKRP